MRALVDRIIIFLLCAVTIIRKLNIEKAVVVAIIAFCIIGFEYYIKESIAKYILMGLLCGLAFVDGGFVAFFPVVVYGMLGILQREYFEKRNIASLVTSILIGVVDIYLLIANGIEENVLTFVFVILAAWLWVGTERYERYRHLLIVTRDSDAQLQMELENRNRLLMEKQDGEIYMATLKERNRIAREIHDNVGHMLSRSLLQMGAIVTINRQENLAKPLSELKNTLDTAMTNIRTSVHDLHEESVNLLMAVKETVAPLHEYKVNLVYDVNGDVERLTKYAIIGILKEAVANIIKHSNATNVEIMIREHPVFYQLVIYDNGNKTNSKEPGIGLINMRDRVEGLGGTINITGESGFKIFITIPKKKEQ